MDYMTRFYDFTHTVADIMQWLCMEYQPYATQIVEKVGKM